MAWTYTQNFNSLSTADLNSQDSWSGDTGFDVVTGTPTPYEGAKCVKGTTPADSSDHEITRSITSTTSGVVYVSALINTSGGSDKRAFIKLKSGSTVGVFLKFFANGLVYLETTGPANTTITSGLSLDTWYRFGIEFNAATDQARVNVNNGPWSSWYTTSAAFGDIDSVVLNTNDNVSSASGYVAFDAIGPTYLQDGSAITNDLASYYKLDEASGNNTDSVGSNTLTNNGSQTTGKINNGTSFSGSVKNVKTSPSGMPSGDTDRSISGWYNFSSISNTNGTETWLTGFGSQGATGQEFYITLRGTGTATRFQADIYGEAQSGTVDTGLTTGGWHHIALVYTASGTSWAYYLDGSLKDTITKANLNTPATPSELNIGGRMTYGAYFTGVADEVGIWGRALTSTEITTLYNGGSGLQYPFVTGTNYPLTASQGSFTLTGQSSSFRIARTLTAAYGSFVLTGVAATLTKGVGYLMSAATGLFTLLGVGAGLRAKLTTMWTDEPEVVSHWTNEPTTWEN